MTHGTKYQKVDFKAWRTILSSIIIAALVMTSFPAFAVDPLQVPPVDEPSTGSSPETATAASTEEEVPEPEEDDVNFSLAEPWGFLLQVVVILLTDE